MLAWSVFSLKGGYECFAKTAWVMDAHHLCALVYCSALKWPVFDHNRCYLF
jgi:hypothetical protein